MDLYFLSTTWFITTGIVLLAAFIRGVVGFGLSLVLAPIMLLFIEPKSVVIFNLLLGMLCNIFVLTQSFKMINIKRLLPLLIFSIIGVPVGIFIITIISPAALKILIGSITVIFAMLLLFNLTPHFAHERPASYIAGLLGGVLTSSTSLGGPPVVLFMHSQTWRRQEIHPSLAAYFLFTTSLSLIGLSISGSITSTILVNTASLIPGLVIGLFVGMIAFKHVNERYFRILSIGVIVCTGVLAVLSGFGILN